jgi:hypothetical protein
MIRRKKAPVSRVGLVGQKIPLLDCVKSYSEERSAGEALTQPVLLPRERSA